MSSQLQQISFLCAELRSEKPPTRNKAAERLETILINSKDELIQRLRIKNKDDITWIEIFTSAVDATLKHAAKVVEQKEQKSIQALLNKNHIYRSIINKLIDYNLENSNNFLPKSVFYQAFCNGFSTESAIKIFGGLFLQILERGIYKCPLYIRELKVDEYSHILSCLFELSVPSDEIFRFEVLSCIVKTVELAVKYVHIQDEFIDYLPEILPFARKANDDRKRSDIIKLYNFFISQLAIDYHHTVCISLQDILPILCDFYNVQLKPEIKEVFFVSIRSSIHAIYPDINNGNFEAIKVTIKDSWPKTIHKLKSIIDVEIRERRMTLQRPNQTGLERCLEQFVEMASTVVYVLFWHVNDNTIASVSKEPPNKIVKTSDKLDYLVCLVQHDKSFNEIWFAILGALLNNQHKVINFANYQELLTVLSSVLNLSSNALTWRSIRRCLNAILIFEETNSSSHNKAYLTSCTETWNNIVNFLISESSENNNIVTEKLLLLQSLIKAGKLKTEASNNLIQSIITNSILRRSEAFETIRQILINCDICGIDKNTNIIEKILAWAYEVNEKINARSLLLNITPVDIKLINDTCVIAVTNFLNEQQVFPFFTQQDELRVDYLNMLQYKYNITFVCLEEHGKLSKKTQEIIKPTSNSSKVLHNCLFQNTYEFLMRTVNIEISKDTKYSNIVADMASLYKLADLLKTFLYYEVFTKQNLNKCPLIKRVGFFLSHMEFQLKSNDPHNIERTELLEILQHLEPVVKTFTSNAVLTQFLETQPLEELVYFLGRSLSHGASQHLRDKSGDWTDIRFISLRILADLCALNTYKKDAFLHISLYVFNIRNDLDILLPLIKIFCEQKGNNIDEDCQIGKWFVDKLKLIFKLYYMDLQIMDTLVEMLPEIFQYVYSNDELLDIMFVALTSLLKIAFKKNYSAGITSKLLKSIRLISRQCEGIWANEGFIAICISVMKFLYIPSLQIQFAVIITITSLMDADWLKSTSSSLHAKEHQNICQQLFSAINWRNFSDSTTDLTQNRNSVIMQLSMALIAFSSYYQEHVLKELSNFYASKKLTEDDLREFTQICDFFGCTRTDLTKPYINSLIKSWIANKWPILKYPYFLCYSSKDEFIKENISVIAASTILYVPDGDLKKLNRYATEEELIKHSLPFLQAFILPKETGCPEAQTENYRKYIEVLNLNSRQFKLNLRQPRELDYNTYWETIYTCYTVLKVDDLSIGSFKFPSLYVTPIWYHLSYKSLLKCLSFYLIEQNITEECDPKAFFIPICNNPLQFLKVLGALKADVYSCLFLNDKISYFYKYCCAFLLIIDSIPSQIITKRHKSIAEYFVRDGILFITQLLQKAQYTELHLAGFLFLQHLFEKPYLNDGGGREVISFHLNEITKCLITFAHNDNLCLKLIKHLMTEFGENAMVFYKFPETENFNEFIVGQNTNKTSPNNIKDLLKILESSMIIQKCGNDTLGTIRQYLAKHKAELCGKGELFSELIHRLLGVMCKAENTNLRLDAAKCLGEIGSLDIPDAAFYFQTQSSFYESVANKMDNPELFSISLAKILDKMLMQFEPRTYKTLFEITTQLVNTKYAKAVIELFPYLAIFQSANKSKCDWDPSNEVDAIDWLFVLSSTESLVWSFWVCAFVSKVFNSCGWTVLRDLASQDIYFANEIFLPFIMLLMSNKEIHMGNIISMLEYYFKEVQLVFETDTYNQLNNREIFKDKRITTIFLNICECVRIKNECVVPINLLHVAKASNYCQAYFMSIIYTELWALSERNTQAKLEEIVRIPAFQQIATKAYKSIGCFDAISGFLSPLQSRLEFLNLNNNWSEMLLQNSFTNATGDELCTLALKRNGILCLGDLGNRKIENSVDYEVCWRLCQWDMPVEGHLKVNIKNDPELEFKKHHFNALKCLHNREQQNCLAAIENARQCVIHNFMGISTECLQSVYKYLTWLHILQQAEDFCQVQFIPEDDIESIFSKWKVENNLKYGSFHCKELVLSHQITLFNTAGVRGQRRIIDFFKYNPIETCLLNVIKECKKSGEINLAKRNILALRESDITNEHVKLNSLLEDADINFRCGNMEITEALLKYALTHKDLGACPQQARALRMYGEFLLETNSQSFDYVLEKMFNRSICYLEKIFKSQKYSDNDDLSFLYLDDLKPADFENANKKEAYQIIANYADREYIQSNMYINSEEFKLKCKIIEQNRQTADSVGRQNKDRDINHGMIIMKKYANLDETEIKFVEEKRTINLCIAVKNYMKFCEIDSDFSNIAIYRIISLWFANKQDQALHKEIKDNIASIPSYKFICAINQITARLNSKHNDFVFTIKEILTRCLQDHPHHSLYQLYPLIFDDTGSKSNDTRSTIASEIITKGRNTLNAMCTKQLATAFPALIQFAGANCEKGTTMPLSDKLKKLRNLDAVHCPTLELPVMPNKNYIITSILKWEERVSLVGGINAPKKLVCFCADGKLRPQLLKGRDDLRQDAVMQHYFTLMNSLFCCDPKTSKGKINIRTYKVVPLSMRSGILEWCENTVPVGVYLGSGSDKSGAHKKYRPHDLTPYKCRQLSMQHLKSDMQKRLLVYDQICGQIKPVFHNFLLEKFVVPGVWFERRLAYTNSMAANSMVGFVVGLGDRHTQNILIDEKTAEVIHIDFGIAFEQGKIMPTPETVPFRLTRDMVAPMGICETGGVFKKACQATLEVLRKNHSVIITILEVLLYNPLYIWNVVPVSAVSKDDEKNLTAQRALLCVQHKLEGRLSSITGTVAADVQVQRVINDAVSKHNLCRLYPGWDPYL